MRSSVTGFYAVGTAWRDDINNREKQLVFSMTRKLPVILSGMQIGYTRLLCWLHRMLRVSAYIERQCYNLSAEDFAQNSLKP